MSPEVYERLMKNKQSLAEAKKRREALANAGTIPKPVVSKSKKPLEIKTFKKPDAKSMISSKATPKSFTARKTSLEKKLGPS